MNTQAYHEKVYSDAYTAITTCLMEYNVPFSSQCNEMVAALEKIKSSTPDEMEQVVQESQNGIAVFFHLYNAHTTLFIEKVSEILGNQIRRSTINDDIRAMSVDSIAKRLRHEALTPIDTKLELVQSKIQELGLKLENVSTLKSAAIGGATGAAIGHVFTDGKKTKDFAVSGALIGAIAAEKEKAMLRQEILAASYAGISSISESLGKTIVKLADQYLSFALGSKIDFDKQDSLTKALSSFGSRLSDICEKQFSIIKAAQSQFDKFGEAVIKVRKPIKRRVWCGVYFGLWIFLGTIAGNAIKDKEISENLGYSIQFLAPLIPYLVYRLFLKKRLCIAALSKLPSEIENLRGFISLIPEINKDLALLETKLVLQSA